VVAKPIGGEKKPSGMEENFHINDGREKEEEAGNGAFVSMGSSELTRNPEGKKKAAILQERRQIAGRERVHSPNCPKMGGAKLENPTENTAVLKKTQEEEEKE